MTRLFRGPNDERQQDAEDLMYVSEPPAANIIARIAPQPTACLTNHRHEMYRIVLDNKLYVTPIGDNIQVGAVNCYMPDSFP